MQNDNATALAFSGGKDSLACLYLAPPDVTLIWVNTGKAYPETLAIMEEVRKRYRFCEVKTDRDGQNECNGIPSDIVPVNWTREGFLVTRIKRPLIQSYITCHTANVFQPLTDAARYLGVRTLLWGVRATDPHWGAAQPGQMANGIRYEYPIWDWSDAQVLAFLKERMELPEHLYLTSQSSLDCYDCTAYRAESKGRLDYTKKHHPELYEAYLRRKVVLDEALVSAGLFDA